MTLRAHFLPLPDRTTLEARWRALEARSEASFFLGWTWIGAWLDAYDVRPELLAVIDGDQDVALALVGHAMTPRLLGRTATLCLNQAGHGVVDRPFIEYNGLLTQTGREAPAAQAVLSALAARRDWRVMHLAGVAPGSALLDLPAHRRTKLDDSPVYQVDLEAVRAAGGDYLSLLSANTRGQIRRAVREHGNALPAVTRAAHADIGPWLDEMHRLNRGRHADNAWDDDAFRHFAAVIAGRGLEGGEVELLRFTGADGPVGLLLNFIHRGVALNYQSAFAAPRSAKDKPGLLCHAAAVGDYAARGFRLYSLLAGKDRYKQSLATCEERLEWWALERFSPRLEAEAALRRLLRRPISA
ncbi:CelD/BcsL family acetyltransferase involved in cellulose biosynthesis [Sphingobium wenxiniae]|uniref:CelD/BcsL family acetyltransferase involved in cellulose biosynthesis n=1 Tax=Sphingobium wenxiniae (strain DSM 21828 / CGMCC 1.7748 / JZ-1) TaxID=595605 RepID=A0A562KDJ7_SPHWJ|nr:GNAT family N-acetyltransferase [Sphingobium wenxiniae]MBB6191301.1 CelD/BcsL family acetyltransferase involved in cellulose biosynthesis [Sphingobium wenxiniae]TWH93404.1 CelD/BcsL family acetyltransferase involved in cellulose biosynthesis [Sphingobium wenxiniae]